MLARPEIGTREHIRLWVAGKDPKLEYNWCSSRDCPCGQYCREYIGADYNWMSDPALAPAIAELNGIAGLVNNGGRGIAGLVNDGRKAGVRTFGDLQAALTSQW